MSEMERVRAAREVLDTRRFENDEEAQMAAFMGIFHPGHPATGKLVADARIKKLKRKRQR